LASVVDDAVFVDVFLADFFADGFLVADHVLVRPNALDGDGFSFENGKGAPRSLSTPFTRVTRFPTVYKPRLNGANGDSVNLPIRGTDRKLLPDGHTRSHGIAKTAKSR
jgi:hypothetical protein